MTNTNNWNIVLKKVKNEFYNKSFTLDINTSALFENYWM